jgi:hypothetical protein
MSRFSPWMRDYTHGGEERLIQLRQLVNGRLQLKQEVVETHDDP